MSEIEKMSEQSNRLTKLETPVGTVLRPCLFCGGEAVVYGRNALYGLSGAWVRCQCCGAQGPVEAIHEVLFLGDVMCTPVTESSLERGKREAITSWNLIANRRKRNEYKEAIT